MTRDYPYTADDLRYIADKVEDITDAIGGGDLTEGDWRWGLSVDVFDDGDEIAGQVRPHGDGWIGFYPKGIPT